MIFIISRKLVLLYKLNEKIDSVNKTKLQIYTDTKMFIAEYWKSAQNVIQNDDKDAGVILIKGSTTKFCTFMLNTHTFIFSSPN